MSVEDGLMIKGVSKLLNYFQSERHRRSEKGQEALEKLHEAVHETTKYLKSESHDPEIEMQLSNLWGLAAISVRNISKDLTDRSYIKSGYWRDPDSWTFERVIKSRISLEEINAELSELIRK